MVASFLTLKMRTCVMNHTEFPNAVKRSNGVWMLYVATKAVGIEVNRQLSEFTLQNHKMTLLDQNIIEDPDFAETCLHALKDASDVACAGVMQTTNRFWWRLVGRRYDVVSWGPDARNYYDMKGVRDPKLSRQFPKNLRPGKQWVADI